MFIYEKTKEKYSSPTLCCVLHYTKGVLQHPLCNFLKLLKGKREVQDLWFHKDKLFLAALQRINSYTYGF